MVGKHIAFCPVEALLLYPFCPHLRANPKKELSLQQWTSSPCPDWDSELCVGYVGCVWALRRPAGLEGQPADRVPNVQLVIEAAPQTHMDLVPFTQWWFNVRQKQLQTWVLACLWSECAACCLPCFWTQGSWITLYFQVVLPRSSQKAS